MVINHLLSGVILQVGMKILSSYVGIESTQTWKLIAKTWKLIGRIRKQGIDNPWMTHRRAHRMPLRFLGQKHQTRNRIKNGYIEWLEWLDMVGTVGT